MLAGLDIGTTGCKVTIFNEKGKSLYRSYQTYKTIHKGTTHEINPSDLFNAVKTVLKDACSKYDVKALGVNSFGEAFAMLDEFDQPLTNVITCSDARGEEEIDELVAKLGADKIRKITGLNPHCSYSLGKLLWIKNHLSDVYSKTKRVLLMQDFIVYMLTGNPCIDFALATRTLAFDLNTLSWSKDIFEASGVDINLFSKPVKCGTNVGKVKPDVKKELGLANDLCVIACGHDQEAAAIGSGVFDEKHATDGAGTVECIVPVFKGLDYIDSLVKNNLCVVPFLNKDEYLTYAFSYTSGSLVEWYKNLLGPEVSFNELEDGFLEHPTGMLLLPHFSGAATPYMDVDSKGALVGLTLDANRSTIYQAILEGITYEMRINFECLKKAHIRPKYLIATGGGANSTKWLQMKADVLNVKIITLEGTDAGSRGCAMMAGVSLGIYKDLNEAAKIMIHKHKVIKPNKIMHEEYNAIFARYKKLYKAVKGVL